MTKKTHAALKTPTDLSADGVSAISHVLNILLADSFALYLKTKNFHWHVTGPHFRDYHRILDEHADEIIGATDDMAERVRKIGGTSLRSIGHVSRLQTITDNDADFVTAQDMMDELRQDNLAFVAALRKAHDLCDQYNDIATASLIENWVDEAEKRVWFLFEITQQG